MVTYNDVINSAELVLVEFYASWCPHCQRMMPVVKEVKEDLQGRCDVYQYDIDDNQQLASKNQVESIPTFLLYKNGKEVWRNSGEMTKEQLESKVESHI